MYLKGKKTKEKVAMENIWGSRKNESWDKDEKEEFVYLPHMCSRGKLWCENQKLLECG